MRHRQGVLGRNVDVRLDPDLLPVPTCHRIHGSRKRHTNGDAEVGVIDIVNRMSAAASGLTHDLSAPEVLEVICESLCRRECPVANQHPHRYIRESRALDESVRPELKLGVGLANVDAAELLAAFAEVADQELNDGRSAAAILAEIDDQSICASEEVHRGHSSGARTVVVREPVKGEVSDIPFQDFDLPESRVQTTQVLGIVVIEVFFNLLVDGVNDGHLEMGIPAH